MSDATRPYDGELTVRGDDGWWCIERAEHDGKMWLERTSPNSASLMCSSRITNADIEGDGADMLAIADAIEKRGSFSARRCAARVEGESVYLSSPRNSMYEAVVSLPVADRLAAEIRRIIR